MSLGRLKLSIYEIVTPREEDDQLRRVHDAKIRKPPK
jgi:hypothetical protein